MSSDPSYSSRKPLWLWVLIPIFLLGGLFLLFGTIGAVDVIIREIALHRGNVVQGSVVSKIHEGGDIWLLSYRYNVPGSTAAHSPLLAGEQVSQDVYDHVDIGAPVKVRYARGDPSNAELVPGDRHAGRYAFFGFAILWLTGITIFLAWAAHGIFSRLKRKPSPSS